MLRTLEEELALACVAREQCGAIELPGGLIKAAELREKVSSHARQAVITLEHGLQSQLIDEREPGLGAKGHSDRDCAVQVNNR
jgi:hypothetical protein